MIIIAINRPLNLYYNVPCAVIIIYGVYTLQSYLTICLMSTGVKNTTVKLKQLFIRRRKNRSQWLTFGISFFIGIICYNKYNNSVILKQFCFFTYFHKSIFVVVQLINFSFYRLIHSTHRLLFSTSWFNPDSVNLFANMSH